MKMRSIFALFFAFALTLSACDSDNNNDDNDEDGGNLPGATGKMEASIDGVQWTAANASANSVSAGGVSTLIIAGATTSADAMTISFLGTVTTSTYNFGDQGISGISFIEGGASVLDTYFWTSGSVTITTINNDKVVGSFSFEALRNSDNNTITVTSGSFDVGYGINIGL